MKKIYITLVLIMNLFLMGCSIDSLIPTQETKEKINSTITQIQDKVDTTWKEIEKIEKNVKENIQKVKTRLYENKSEKFSFEFPDWRNFQENRYWFNTIVFTPKDDEIKENVWVSLYYTHISKEANTKHTILYAFMCGILSEQLDKEPL